MCVTGEVGIEEDFGSTRTVASSLEYNAVRIARYMVEHRSN